VVAKPHECRVFTNNLQMSRISLLAWFCVKLFVVWVSSLFWCSNFFFSKFCFSFLFFCFWEGGTGFFLFRFFASCNCEAEFLTLGGKKLNYYDFFYDFFFFHSGVVSMFSFFFIAFRFSELCWRPPQGCFFWFPQHQAPCNQMCNHVYHYNDVLSRIGLRNDM